MKYKFIDENKLKITLTAPELEALGIDPFYQDTASKGRLKRGIVRLLAALQLTGDLSPKGDRVAVELYPEPTGGCVVLIDTEPGPPPDAFRPMVFCFADAVTMIDACTRLFSQYGHRLLKSALYRSPQGYWLVLHPLDGPQSACAAMLSEYGERSENEPLCASLLEEHAEILIGERAVDTISYYFS